jgi:hypothetical protein
MQLIYLVKFLDEDTLTNLLGGNGDAVWQKNNG